MLKLRLLLLELEVIGDTKQYSYDKCFIYTVRGIRTNMFLKPWTAALLIALISVYITPELGHLSEKMFRILLWKYVTVAKFMLYLEDPIDCKNDKCCMPLKQRRKMMKEIDSGLTLDSIYFMAAVEIGVFAVYLYPDCGHLIGDICRFLCKKFVELWKQT